MDVTIWPLAVFAGLATFVVAMIALERHQHRKVLDSDDGLDDL